MRLSAPKLTRSQGKVVLWIIFGLAVGYILFGAYVWHAMRQPPEVFGRVMARMPQPAVFIVFPFETLWTSARAGTLHIGDPAPDFTLNKLDKTGSVQLSSFAAQKRPVVLIFGSYT
jgi:hypothetical protein